MAAGLFDAYVAGEARSFYGASFAVPADRALALERARRPLSAEVLAALSALNGRLGESQERQRHLEALAAGAPVVVTGQQVGLFLGPLFNLYKAMSAVLAARELARASGRPVVPVFWLQTEDHDLVEIARTFVPSAVPGAGPCALELPADPADRSSVAYRRLPAEVGGVLSALGRELEGLPHAAEHLGRLARHYTAGASWSAAFAGVLAELFAELGLVFVDGRDPALARVAAGVHRRAIAEAEPIAELLLARVLALEAAGFTAGVHVRPKAPLSFFHPGGPDGPRYRLAPDGEGGFSEVGGSGRHTRAALLSALEAQPLAMSSSALLRPIVQDTLLPTAAYVGGPAEVAYFAQLMPLYQHFGLPPPLVVPRARLTLLEERTHKLLGRLGAVPADAALPVEALCHKGGGADAETLKARLLEPFEAALASAAPELVALGLASPLERTRGTVAMAVSKLAEKHAAALAHKDAERLDAARRLKAFLRPNDEPQERVLSPAYFFARHGERAVLDRLAAAITPFDATPREVTL